MSRTPVDPNPGTTMPPTRPVPDTDTLDEEPAVRHSPPGTDAGHNTTQPDASDQEPSEEHRQTGERARQDAESAQENTDRYDTSGRQEDPPKTPYER